VPTPGISDKQREESTARIAQLSARLAQARTSLDVDLQAYKQEKYREQATRATLDSKDSALRLQEDQAHYMKAKVACAATDKGVLSFQPGDVLLILHWDIVEAPTWAQGQVLYSASNQRELDPALSPSGFFRKATVESLDVQSDGAHWLPPSVARRRQRFHQDREFELQRRRQRDADLVGRLQVEAQLAAAYEGAVAAHQQADGAAIEQAEVARGGARGLTARTEPPAQARSGDSGELQRVLAVHCAGCGAGRRGRAGPRGAAGAARSPQCSAAVRSPQPSVFRVPAGREQILRRCLCAVQRVAHLAAMDAQRDERSCLATPVSPVSPRLSRHACLSTPVSPPPLAWHQGGLVLQAAPVGARHDGSAPGRRAAGQAGRAAGGAARGRAGRSRHRAVARSRTRSPPRRQSTCGRGAGACVCAAR
jgi:hypothetical protein